MAPLDRLVNRFQHRTGSVLVAQEPIQRFARPVAILWGSSLSPLASPSGSTAKTVVYGRMYEAARNRSRLFPAHELSDEKTVLMRPACADHH